MPDKYPSLLKTPPKIENYAELPKTGPSNIFDEFAAVAMDPFDENVKPKPWHMLPAMLGMAVPGAGVKRAKPSVKAMLDQVMARAATTGGADLIEMPVDLTTGIRKLFDSALNDAYQARTRSARKEAGGRVNRIYEALVKRGEATGAPPTAMAPTSPAEVKQASDAGLNLKTLSKPPVVRSTPIRSVAGDPTRADDMVKALEKFKIKVSREQYDVIRKIAEEHAADGDFLNHLKRNLSQRGSTSNGSLASPDIAPLPIGSVYIMQEYRKLRPSPLTGAQLRNRRMPMTAEEERAKQAARNAETTAKRQEQKANPAWLKIQRGAL